MKIPVPTPQRWLLQRVIDLIDDVGPGHENLRTARNLIAEAAIEPECHVGREPSSMDDVASTEWLLGQLASIIDREAWFAMNTFINISNSFLDGSWPKVEA